MVAQVAPRVPSIDALKASWRRSLEAGNKAPKTITSYEQSVDKLVAFLAAKGMPTSISGVRREHIEAFLADARATKRPASVAVYYRSLQQFFRWAVDEDEIAVSPMAKIKPPIVPEQLTPVLSQDDLRRLLASADGKSFADRRDKAILTLLASTPMRRGEVAGLSVESIDLAGKFALVMGKGRRPRVVPFGARAALALDRYLRVRQAHRDADRPELWLGLAGPMTDSGIYQVVRDRAKSVGLTVHPHQFRHSFAHDWMKTGGAEGDLMSLAGWKSRAMLNRYGASAAAERAQEAYRRYTTPADRL